MRFRASASSANDNWRRILVFSLIWALTIPACSILVLMLSGWHADTDVLKAVTPFLPGSFIGGYCGALAAIMMSRDKPQAARFSAFFLCVAVATLGFSAIIYTLHFRIYFSEFHQPFGTLIWVLQSVFTSMGSLYLFAASAVRTLFPFGFLALVLASFLFSRGWLMAKD